ncbi:hypothetical protein N234_10240 [Ralstonia pickettii DTP0602]|nr:hypothetical protein N234_10240 [Ralstonia pickettii DTP0602]
MLVPQHAPATDGMLPAEQGMSTALAALAMNLQETIMSKLKVADLCREDPLERGAAHAIVGGIGQIRVGEPTGWPRWQAWLPPDLGWPGKLPIDLGGYKPPLKELDPRYQ